MIYLHLIAGKIEPQNTNFYSPAPSNSNPYSNSYSNTHSNSNSYSNTNTKQLRLPRRRSHGCLQKRGL